MSRHVLTGAADTQHCEAQSSIVCAAHLAARLAEHPLRADHGERVSPAGDDCACEDCPTEIGGAS